MLTDSNSKLSIAQEDYLRDISKLSRDSSPVTISTLAHSMGVTAPSASAMIQRLQTEGLVHHLPRAGITLTPKGEEMAKNVHRRHRLIETFLVNVLGLDWSEVHEEAEALEHHLSERLVKAIDRYLGFPKTDPHGHPIPASDGSMVERNLMPIEKLGIGERSVLREIGSDDPERIRRWKELGFVPGVTIFVKEHHPIEDLWKLDVEEKEVITGTEGIMGLKGERIS